jgi:SAM-dependent methyltransferase
LDATAATAWAALAATRLFAEATAAGRLIGTTEAPAEAVEGLEEAGRWARVLEHERLPFVSHPSEWTWSMMRDAGRLQLELLLAALDEGMTLKDGSAFNVQWRGADPVFIDVGSFEPAGGGGPWLGYREFCQTCLYPLMLQSCRSVPFQPWLRGQVHGLTPAQMARLLHGRDRLRPGVFRHVHLHHLVETRLGSRSTRAVEGDLRRAGFTGEVTKSLTRKLLQLLDSLPAPKRRRSIWSDYRDNCSYSGDERRAKEAFVDEVVDERQRGLVLDLGCNDGAFARRAARRADLVVAVDGDDGVVDDLYRSLRGGSDRVLPLVMDLRDPTPGTGWRGAERRSFEERARGADLVLALALVHHLAIGGNVPLDAVVDWLRSFDGEVVVEFVDPADPMAARLLANKPAGIHDDYRLDVFEPLLSKAFEVVRRTSLSGGTRTLFHARPRP